MAIAIAESLVELHTKNPPVVHRDLKPQNIFLDKLKKVFLGDFGLSYATPIPNEIELLDTNTTTNEVHERKQSARSGTDYYKAPEVWVGSKEDISISSDIYSFGVVLHEIFAGTRPCWNDCENKRDLLYKHLKNEEVKKWKLKQKQKPEEKQVEYDSLPLQEEILNDQGLTTLIKKCLHHEASCRPSAEQCLLNLRVLSKMKYPFWIEAMYNFFRLY